MKTTKKILGITLISVLAITTLGACAYVPSQAAQNQNSKNQFSQNRSNQETYRVTATKDRYGQENDSYPCDESYDSKENSSRQNSNRNNSSYGDSSSRWNDSSHWNGFGMMGPGMMDDYDQESYENNASSIPYGASLAFADEDLTLEKMLTYAIEDEYLAHAEYAQIILEYGNQTPYSNIIKAEETHISMLTPLFDTYNIPLPNDEASTYTITTSSLLESAKTGVTAEINNIEMYNLFLQQDLPDDVKAVFTSLRNASMQHLNAFERQVDKLS